ncbi:MAG: hypothetical protein AAB739_04465 [Patescibacteria group bacterium]
MEDNQNHFRPNEQEILDTLPPPTNGETICRFQNDVRWDVNAVLCYRYVHYQEPPFEPLAENFIDHLKICHYCQTFLSLPPAEAREAQQQKENILKVLRSPEGLILMYKKIEKRQGAAKSQEEITERRAPLAVYRMLDAIASNDIPEFLLAMMRLKVAQFLEKIFFGQDQHKKDDVYAPCPKPEYPYETADRIDLIYKTLNNGTMKAPDSLLDYFEHAITCETCQVSLSIPNDKQDELVITSWVSKIRTGELARVIAEKEMLKGYARSPSESEHVEEIFREALRQATNIEKSH